MDSIQKLNPDPAKIRNEFLLGESSYGRLFSIIHRQYAESVGKSRWGIQVGMVEKEANFLFQIDPDAKIIHMIRNPFERIRESVSTSIRSKLSLGLETSLWRESARLAKENLKNNPNQYMVVKWEDLMRDIDQTLNGICKFIGEEFMPEIINPKALSEMGFDLDSTTKFGHRSLVDNNHRSGYHLTKNDRTYISDSARLEMAWFGYPDKKNNLQVYEKLKYLSMDYPSYFLGKAIKNPLRYIREVKKKMMKRNYLWQKIT